MIKKRFAPLLIATSCIALLSQNTSYVSNLPPLVDAPFTLLPTGTVKPDGWLLTMLQFQRDGATGAAESLYSELGANSAWLGGTADASDWERPPYYVKGLVTLAYVLSARRSDHGDDRTRRDARVRGARLVGHDTTTADRPPGPGVTGSGTRCPA